MEKIDKNGIITKVTGPLIVAKNMESSQVYDVVKVSNRRLTGEIIELRGGNASIQVYEETAGIGPGEPVYFTKEPLSVELGPGLIGSIFDGIQRPLTKIYEVDKRIIPAGIDVPRLDRQKLWNFIPEVKIGEAVSSGDVLGIVQETSIIKHFIMVPIGKNERVIQGKVTYVFSGEGTIDEVVAKIEKPNGQIVEVKMMQTWPVRKKRPYKKKVTPQKPMITGQRVIDTLFPVAIGGLQLYLVLSEVGKLLFNINLQNGLMLML